MSHMFIYLDKRKAESEEIMTREEAHKKLADHLICFRHDFGWDVSTIQAIEMGIEALSADREKGEWIYNEFTPDPYNTNHSFKCSECGCVILEKTKFCPNCGADMRKGD